MKRVVAAVLLFASCSCEPEPDPLRVAAFHHLRDARPEARVAAIRTLAEGATRGELAAIVRASEGAPAEVKVAAAEALGQSTLPEAVEFLGAMVLEPDVQGSYRRRFSTEPVPGDEDVRAAAVQALAKKSDPKAKAYLARSWADGGPRTRVTVARSGAEVLAQALEAEKDRRLSRAHTDREDPRVPVRAAALEELAQHGDPSSLALVTQALVEGHPLESAAAASALARIGAAGSVPELIAQLDAQRSPPVMTAVAEALHVLGAKEAAPALSRALANASGEAASAILSALESVEPDDAVRTAACAAAGRFDEASLASRAARLAGASCVLPVPKEDDSPEVLAARFAALTGASHRAPEVLPLARKSLDHEDARVAAAAAAWLSLAGEASDAQRLFVTARDERRAVIEGHLQRDTTRRFKKEVVRALADQKRAQRARVGAPMPATDMPRRLAQLLAQRKTTSEVAAFSPRPDFEALLVASAVGAAKLGVDIQALAETMLSDGDLVLRLAAVDIADVLAGEAGEALREMALTNNDPSVVLAMVLRDLAAGRDGALQRAIELVEVTDDPTARGELALALEPHAAQAVDALLTLTTGRDSAVPLASWALRDVEGEAVTRMFTDRLLDPRFLGALDAARALATRPGDEVSRALTDAAVHPVAEVQVAALEALAARNDCASAAMLKPLQRAFDGRVRRAAAEFEQACAAR